MRRTGARTKRTDLGRDVLELANAVLLLPPVTMAAPIGLFYPVLDEAEARTGVPDRKVVHPTAQHRVDQLHDPSHWLGGHWLRLVAADHFLELP
jgi:hypothetical protein